MGTNCAPLLAYLFLHAYEADFFNVFSRIKIENYPRHLIPASAIQMMFCDLTIHNSLIIYMYIASIQMSFKVRTLLIIKSLLLTLTFTLKLPTKEDQKQNYDKCGDFTFQITNFSFNQQQYSSITNVRSLHSTTHALFQNLCSVVIFWTELSC